jgi:hypothetical protein
VRELSGILRQEYDKMPPLQLRESAGTGTVQEDPEGGEDVESLMR